MQGCTGSHQLQGTAGGKAKLRQPVGTLAWRPVCLLHDIAPARHTVLQLRGRHCHSALTWDGPRQTIQHSHLEPQRIPLGIKLHFALTSNQLMGIDNGGQK